MTFWKLKPSLTLTQNQKSRTASATKTWLDRLTDKDCHFDPYDDSSNGVHHPTFEELAERIAGHAGIIPPSASPSASGCPFKPTIASSFLGWAQPNALCMADLWKNIADENISPKSGLTKDGVILQRHNFFGDTLNNINYISLTFTTQNSINLGYGFWLIEHNKDFAYAILNYIMFRAWCGLTACVYFKDDGRGFHKGDQHFAEGGWDTFPIKDINIPLSNLTLSPAIKLFQKAGCTMVKEAIEKAGEWLRTGWKAAISFDDCMDELCRFPNLTSSLQQLSQSSLSKTSPSLSVATPFSGKNIMDAITLMKEYVEKGWPTGWSSLGDCIDKLYGFGNLSNLKLSELPLSGKVAGLFINDKNIKNVKDALEEVEKWQKRGWARGAGRKMVTFDECMNELCNSVIRYSLSLQILAQGFLVAFYG